MLEALQTACYSVSNDTQTVISAVCGLEVDDTLHGEVLLLVDGVGDVGSEVDIETARRVDHEHNVLPLEVTKDHSKGCSRYVDVLPLEVMKDHSKGCSRHVERRCTAD